MTLELGEGLNASKAKGVQYPQRRPVLGIGAKAMHISIISDGLRLTVEYGFASKLILFYICRLL